MQTTGSYQLLGLCPGTCQLRTMTTRTLGTRMTRSQRTQAQAGWQAQAAQAGHSPGLRLGTGRSTEWQFRAIIMMTLMVARLESDSARLRQTRREPGKKPAKKWPAGFRRMAVARQ
eukprot:1601756-Rhodomonas_salina.1